MTIFHRLHAILGFLTRLVPPVNLPPDEFGATLPLFPLVGYILALPLILPFALGLLDHHPLAQALLFTLAYIHLTRGLHHDAIADIADAWGATPKTDRFWEIVKDSRIGAFGVMALTLAIASQIILAAPILQARDFGTLAFALAFGRAQAVTLARLSKNLARPGLGSLFLPQATTSRNATALCLALLPGLALTSPATLIIAITLGALSLHRLHRLGQAQAGVNGDFLGSAIILGELGTLLAWNLTH